jgi:hypothetical protein
MKTWQKAVPLIHYFSLAQLCGFWAFACLTPETTLILGSQAQGWCVLETLSQASSSFAAKIVANSKITSWSKLENILTDLFFTIPMLLVTAILLVIVDAARVDQLCLQLPLIFHPVLCRRF